MRPDWGTSENVVAGREERKRHFTAKAAINFRRGDSTVRVGLLDNPWADFREKSCRLHGSKAHFTNQILNLRHKVVSDVNYATKNKLLKFLKMTLIISTCQCYCKISLNIHLEIKPS